MRVGVLVWLAIPSIVLGQGDLQDLRARQRGPNAAQLLARAELERQLGARLDVRWDPASGCPGAIAISPALPLPGAHPSQAVAHLLTRLESLFGRLPLAGQTERRGPHLAPLARRGLGDWVTLELEQRLDGTPIHASSLRVTLRRTSRGYEALSVHGRVFADVPPEVVPASGPAPSADLRRVVTCRPDGVWKEAWAGVEFVATVPHDVLRADDGSLLARRSLERGGQALADVLAQGEGSQPTRVPLPGLHVSVGGDVTTTDAQGRFAGDQGSLPFGLSGPFERVAAASSRYPQADARGLLVLTAGSSLAEATVFYHLGRFRRWAQNVPGLGAQQLQSRLLVLIRQAGSEHNASASGVGTTFEGRRYDDVLRFGSRMAVDPSVVIHERGHALLTRLGFDPQTAAGNIVHEAMADFLAAAYTGSPIMGANMGVARRDIGDDRIYPQHYDAQDTYGSSLILSGALYDALRAAGSRDAQVISASLRGVASGAEELPVLAQRILAASASEVRDVVEEHLRAHGLLPDSSRPPVVEITQAGSALQPYVELRAGETTRVTVSAWDPAEVAWRVETSRLQPMIAGPSFMQRGAITRKTHQDRPTVQVELTFTPTAAQVGRHEVTVTAQSAVTGKTSARSFPVSVLPAGSKQDDPAKSDPKHEPDPSHFEVTLEIPAGTKRRVPLNTLFPPLRAKPSPQDYSWAGTIPGGGAVVGDALVLQPEAHEVGSQAVLIYAEPKGLARSPERQMTCLLTIIVPSRRAGAGEILVERAHLGHDEDADEDRVGKYDDDRQTQSIRPGQPVTIFLPGSETLTVIGAAPDESEDSASSTSLRLALASGTPAWVQLTPVARSGPPAPESGPPGDEPAESAAPSAEGGPPPPPPSDDGWAETQALLVVMPPMDGPRRLTVNLELRSDRGKLLATRALPLVIVPETPVEPKAEPKPTPEPKPQPAPQPATTPTPAPQPDPIPLPPPRPEGLGLTNALKASGLTSSPGDD